ncbi:MAG: hypothetical protein QOH53_1847, partial [Ilumatobacteraceae bacterium]
MSKEQRGRPIPAYVIGVVIAGVVLTVALLAKHVDGSAAIFTGGHFHVGVALGWIVCAGLIALLVTRYVETVANVDEGSGLAVAFDALP